MMKTCPNCGQTVADEAGFCPSCGSAVPAGARPAFDGPFTFCPQCGEKVPAGSYACPNCGAVQPQQVQPSAGTEAPAFCPFCGSRI